jgi:hypothetical protein
VSGRARRTEASAALFRPPSREQAEPAAGGTPETSRPRGVRTDPVRSTVDLPPAWHAWLQEFQNELRFTHGLDRQQASRNAVLVALVAEMRTNESLTRAVRARLLREKN